MPKKTSLRLFLGTSLDVMTPDCAPLAKWTPDYPISTNGQATLPVDLLIP